MPCATAKRLPPKSRRSDGVVVGLGRRSFAPRNVPLGHANARQRRDASRRAEDARQLMQRVDGHVVHGAAAGLTEVPRRVDRDATGRGGPLGLVILVVAAE